MSNDVDAPAGVFVVALAIIVVAIIVVAILYLPVLSLWCLNTLVVVPCHGDELSYALFAKHWWAALLCNGTLGILGGLMGTKKSN